MHSEIDCATHLGKGLHSRNGAAKIKPAIEDLMQKYVPFPTPVSTSLLLLDADYYCEQTPARGRTRPAEHRRADRQLGRT